MRNAFEERKRIPLYFKKRYWVYSVYFNKKKSSYRYHGNIIKVTSISDRLTKRLKRPLLQPVFARNFNFEQGHNRQTEEAGVCSLNSRM